jgi:cob(I)alamin adenosyltransferase
MKPSRGGGDKGETSLLSGERVSKSHARVEACGEVDELNSVLGVLVADLLKGQKDLAEEVRAIQSDLIHMGALLSGTSPSKIAALAEDTIEKRTAFLEKTTDGRNDGLPKLTGFILPGGQVSVAWAHVARAVCRRAERRVVRLLDGAGGGQKGQAPKDGVPAVDDLSAPALRKAQVYLNRLSDHLFVLARRCNQIAGEPDVPWSK